MKQYGTPLGFLPGVIDPGSHCMLPYNKPDDLYIQSIVKYIAAGMASGQMCVCTVLNPTQRLVSRELKRLGVSLTSGQLLMPDACDIYMPLGHFDLRFVTNYYAQQAEIARSKWNGMRVFADASSAMQSRATRIKVLEYEALVNAQPTDVTALCGYQASLLPRSYVLQLKSVHPYIAGYKSMRLNRGFMDTDKFLAAFYRFRRVNRELPATLEQMERIATDLDEIGSRTGMTLPDIEGFKEAATSLFTMLVESVLPRSERSHLHLVYDPKPDKFSVMLGYHRALLAGAVPQWSLPLECKTMDTVHIGECGGDTVITITKRYWSYLNGMASSS